MACKISTGRKASRFCRKQFHNSRISPFPSARSRSTFGEGIKMFDFLTAERAHCGHQALSRSRKPADGALARRCEQELPIAHSWKPVKDFDSFRRKVDDVRLVIFCPLTRQRPEGVFQVNLDWLRQPGSRKA